MADIQVTGFVNSIKYLQDAVLVFVDEYKKGYRKQNGEVTEDKYYSWRVIFKNGLRSYISKYFNHGMLVTIKGEALPFAIEKGKNVDGYSFIGQCINIASFPRATVKAERKMIKESQEYATERPNIEEYNKDDF